MTRRAEAVINALVYSEKESAVVHFGNTFTMQEIKYVPNIFYSPFFNSLSGATNLVAPLSLLCSDIDKSGGGV